MGNIRIVLLAIVGMLAWIGLLAWVVTADWSSARHWLAQGWIVATRLGRTADKGARRLWQPEYIVRGLAAVLVVLAAIFFYMGMNATEIEKDKFARTFAPNIATDCLSLAITILVIDQLYRWRDKVYQQRIDESIAAEHKRNIILQMRSRSNEFALDAVLTVTVEGWLTDGSLQGAVLKGAKLNDAFLHSADLQRADLTRANLEGATLAKAMLQHTILSRANLQLANLAGADLQNADLSGSGTSLHGADLTRANLEGAKLTGAKYDSKTIWPKGFNPIAAGAILVETRLNRRSARIEKGDYSLRRSRP